MPHPASSIQHPASSISDVLRLYAGESAGIRLFVRLRHLLAPLARVASEVPSDVDVLDVGCGHGLFSLLLALANPARRVVGVDPSPAKIGVAQRVGRPVPNVEFRLGSVEAARGPFGAIAINDVLYLLPPEAKLKVLRACRDVIAPGGTLLLKTNDTHPAWKFGIARLQEQAMTGLGLTLGHGGLHFYSCLQNQWLLDQASFHAEVVHLRHWSPYPHTLFVARPSAVESRPPSAIGSREPDNPA
jgi:2-polyprenyl-3-methyl-5-hydroxy-6-metoxy-1,4-benzoquinol methylase